MTFSINNQDFSECVDWMTYTPGPITMHKVVTYGVDELHPGLRRPGQLIVTVRPGSTALSMALLAARGNEVIITITEGRFRCMLKDFDGSTAEFLVSGEHLT